MSGFSIDWLNLREAADRRARDKSLKDQAIQWLVAAENPVAVDLGAGTGSTLRALTSPEQQPLTWRLVDNDTTLLDEAQRRHGETHRIESCKADLAVLTSLPLQGARLVTASALFDLVSENFLDSLATALQAQSQQPVGLYAALNYDGTTHWTPQHPLDDVVLTAFNQDQRTDKGFGPALGPDSAAVMERLFTQAGFRVYTASSPWVLDGADQAMVSELITGIAAAVAENPDIEASALEDWVQFRQANAATGTCSVGHTDVLALPV
ncbi:SPW repeat domain-containing protein [Saccharospirillum mangrovi]|uniref:SPW repeat domain-containing protein n=1 Tax=Saccharospirillum mangrovi TaxID=2161747 RepID=UPI000D39EC7F|nr:SPW repeat protein [Saccharospirillum mangrovi]